MDKISENSGVYPTFSVCPIITHSSTLRTIPVAFIFYDLFFIIITLKTERNINILLVLPFSYRIFLKISFRDKSSVLFHILGVYRTFILLFVLS